MPSFSEVMEARAADTADVTHTGPSPQQIAALLRESHHGATVLSELLDSPAWNVFRSNVGGWLEGAGAERAILRERMEAGELVGDERARADLRLQFLRGLIEAYTKAMALPVDLIARHEKLDALASGGPAPVETAEKP
jgi:hypothetical protein